MSGSRNAQSRRTTPVGPWVYGGLGGENTGQGGSGGGGSSGNPFNSNADDDGPNKRNTVVAATSQQENSRQTAGKSSGNVVTNQIPLSISTLIAFFSLLGGVFGVETYIYRETW
eukprot:CAMPEP_0197354606 /NCGR_PEP_ID=MMETSP0893-20130614/43647_1 /TAXON_ID=44058 ORGANISM="Aureoumbra lagunensis, Strain CCMP1510" /NCGR_SAMPLE_ID=MMETSP0893 /ASSEMBLY_ACC=CAM_ASM_000539 /LENGTH=113 /DNA_ID=CAMNT_0042870887 /DNA_START=41 /DNA_END=379 /DNA_ORIENTATION=-